jgi:hypothetical protein
MSCRGKPHPARLLQTPRPNWGFVATWTVRYTWKCLSDLEMGLSRSPKPIATIPPSEDAALNTNGIR